jgi:lysophospholipase L1-like esterase
MKSGIERSRLIRFASLLPASVLCINAFGQGTTPQQINLLPIAAQHYGVAPFQVIALASSYLPVTITATGPVTLDGRWLTVTGVGTVTVSAHQAGNKVYAPADAEEQFTILPEEPVVQGQSATIVYGTPFTPSILSASAMAVPAADPAADVPTITSQFDTSQITGGASVSVPYNSPSLRYESSPMIQTVTANGRKGLIPDPTMAVDHYYKAAFTCDCQRFEFAVQSQAANYRLWVDGSWTTADTEPLQDDPPRTLFYLVAFPDKRPRQIKVMLDEDTPFFGVNAAASDTISATQVLLGKRAIIFGDSLTTPIISEPTLPPVQPGRAGSGYPQVIGEYFNWDWWETGVSGSGFTVGGIDNLTFVQRALTDICGRNPDLIVLFGGLNDAGSTEESTQQGATDFLSEVNACLPGTPIYLLGPQAPSANVATAMAAAAALFPATVDFAGTAPQYWVYGDRSDPTTGNAYLYLGALDDNGGHPTPLGHDFLAEEVAASIIALSPSLTPQAFNLFAPAPAIGSFAYSEAANTVLAAGDHNISITFTPADAVNYAVVTQPVLLTVNRASSSLALAASSTKIQAGSKLTLTASASPQIAGVPTGTVTFTADGLPLGNAPLDASGSAVFTTAGLTVGTHSISASYAGDGNFLSAPPPLPVKIIVNPTPPQITTITPTYGAPAALIRIVGSNFGPTQGNGSVTVGGAPSYVASWSNTLILIQVPSRATTGNIVVTSAGEASNGVGFTFYPYPAITGISPASGAVGTPVTITGSGLLDGAGPGNGSVAFNGTFATVLSQSSTSIQVNVPPGASSGPVSVYVNGDTAKSSASFTVTPPRITATTPNYGAPAALIVITGTNFGANYLGNSYVTIDGVRCGATAWSDTSIAIRVPSNAATGNLVVTVAGESTNAAPFTFYPYPAITGVTPGSGAVGTPVTITGSNVLDGANNATVTFNGIAAAISSDASGNIQVTVPTGAASGRLLAKINGVTLIALSNFTVTPSP